MKNVWTSINPGYPFEFHFLDEKINQMDVSEVRFSKMFNFFAMVALFIGFIGLYGLSYQASNLRSREFSIRKVLGSSNISILNLLTKEMLLLIGIAAFLALPVSWFALSRWLEAFAYRTNLGLLPFVIAAIIPCLVVLFVVITQVRKISQTNPIEVLKQN